MSMNKFRDEFKKKICTISLVSFLSINPLVGCMDEVPKNNGVIMTQETKKENILDGLKNSSDMGKFMKEFASKNSFDECKLLLEEMLKDSKIGISEKWRALEGTGGIYRDQILDYAFTSIKDKKYSLENSKNLSENDKNNLVVYSNILSFDSEYLKKYAEFISKSSSFLTVLKKDGELLHGVYFRSALITRANIKGVDEALKLSSEFLKNSYSLYVNTSATISIIKIDPKNGPKIINDEIKNTSNPFKQKLLKEVMEEMLRQHNEAEDLLSILDDRTLKSIPTIQENNKT